MDTTMIERMLDVIEQDIVPLTRRGVGEGNKLFGAAILGPDGALVVAETNNETENPLWHGEMHAIRRFFQIDATERPAPADCLFLATHEPCSLCLSGITCPVGVDGYTRGREATSCAGACASACQACEAEKEGRRRCYAGKEEKRYVNTSQLLADK